MSRIQILKDDVINKIAAGEVIDRPASVAKELIENSIDSGATRIEVEISQGGRYIRVSDNGGGIHPDDIALAFSRHATSKISLESDLWSLKSLGFRGEALASILSISKVKCTSRITGSDNGVKAISTNNGELDVNPAGCAIGTSIEVEDLFYNVPARLKFLKKPASEVAAIIDIVQNLAIAHPEVAFICKHQGKIALKTSGSNDLAICLNEIFSKDLLSNLLNINAIDEAEKLFATGVVTDPTFTRSNRQSIFIIVNGRFVKCPIILKAIEKAYEDKIPSGRFPLAVISLMIPPEKLDVNVHPTKKEVKYTSTNSVFGFVYYAIKKALEEGEALQEKEPEEEVKNKARIEPALIQKTSSFLPKNGTLWSPINSPEPIRPIQDHSPESISDILDFYAPLQCKEEAEETSEGHNETPAIFTEQLLIKSLEKAARAEAETNWTIIGQVFDTYIIIQARDQLKIIDQHIASERAIYDKLKSEEGPVSGQRLLVFEEIPVTMQQIAMLDEHKAYLEKWGYEIEIIEENKAAIKQIPHIITGKNQQKLFEEILSYLEDYSSLEALQDNILKSIACHAAVRAGDKLTIREMEEVINKWNLSDYPYTCPHGRQICHSISSKELASFFSR